MSSNIYVVTKEVNEYDQYGSYFVAVFRSSPSIKKLENLNLGLSFEELQHLQEGGGRINTEDQWYWLECVNCGVNYDN